METSAFGVVHKAMSGKKFKALIATKNRGTGRAKVYADRKLSLHRVGPKGADDALKPVVQDKKDVLRDLTRTTRPTRDANRKGIF